MTGGLLLATVAASMTGLFWRLDLTIYDAALPTGPAPKDVVIVAVDDASIDQIGRWPWRRALHAALLDRLYAMGAKAVALDFLLTEPDSISPAGDAALAAAMTRGPRTILPLLVEMPEPGRPLHARLPIPILAAAAAGVGHANLELDRDGMVRSVFLREGIGAPSWAYFTASLLEITADSKQRALPGRRHPDLAGASSIWVRDYQMLIPYLGPPGHFARVSYVDVLRGSVDRSAIAGKLVLVGATAQGIGDAYPTPRSGEGSAMAGVEIAANVLQGLRGGTAIRPVTPWLTVVLALLPILVAAAALLLAPPMQSLILVGLVWVGTLALSLLALRSAGWWLPPTPPLVALVIMYPLWSWRRLEAAQEFLDAELKLLSAERFPLLLYKTLTNDALSPGDFVEQRINVLRRASERLRHVRRLFADTINTLPDATILADGNGRIVLANPAAAALFGVGDYRALEETPVDAQIHRRVGAESLQYSVLSAQAPCTAEAVFDNSGRTVLIRAVPFFGGVGARMGTIIALADITELRAVQRERDEALRFLSHDMKSPASSLLGLAHLQRDPQRALPPQELSERLELLAQRLLTLVDGFVALGRAESADSRAFVDFDLRDAVQDAYDEVWAAAQARNNAIVVNTPQAPCIVRGDRQLLARAVVNLLHNAVKFSPAGKPVSLELTVAAGMSVVRVVDQGPGLVAASKADLFRRFSRGLHRGAGDPGGAGLGLAFVRAVTEKHGGHAWVEDQGSGAVFCLSVPTDSTT